MDRVLPALSSFPPAPEIIKSDKFYDASIRSYITSLSKVLDDTKAIIRSNSVACFEVLDPSTNSIGYLAVLDTLLDRKEPSPAATHAYTLDRLLDFLLGFDPIQIRYVGSAMVSLLEQVASGRLFSPLVSVEALATAILRIDPSGSMFTSTHLFLAKRAYETNCIDAALPVIDKDIVFFPGMGGGKDPRPLCDSDLAPSSYMINLTETVKSQSILEYNLLRGLMYMSRRDWSKAQTALEQVVTHPIKDKTISKIMTEAYKKWVLVGLLNTGVAPTLPAYTSTAAKSFYNVLGKHYNSLAALFNTNQVEKLRSSYQEHELTWEEDTNLILVKEVFAAYPKWQVINLRNIYKQVSISQVRRMTLSAETGKVLRDDQEALALVRQMLDSGMLKGELQTGPTAEETYLAFEEDYAVVAESEFTKEIARSHHSIQSLTKQYELTNERLTGSKDYVRFIVRDQKRQEFQTADAGVGFDSSVEDEDLMTGITSHT